MTGQATSVRIVPCPGATVPARLAQEIAARLEGLVLEGGPAGSVIAIDGCADACATRALGAQGVKTTSIGVHELTAGSNTTVDAERPDLLLAEVAERLRQAASAGTVSRTHRRRPPVLAPDDIGEKRPHTQEDYLYAVRSLTSPLVGCGAVVANLPTLAAHVAGVLGVSRPTAGAMLRKLESEGLIERGPGREVLLTDEGRSQAERVVRRHRIVERLLADVLGYPVAECHALALQIRGEFDDGMAERLAAQLTPPDRCPHGWPLDPADEERELADAVSLTSLPPGPATVVALVEDDVEAVAALDAIGLELDAEIDLTVRERGVHTLVVGGVRHDLDDTTAASVLARARTRR